MTRDNRAPNAAHVAAVLVATAAGLSLAAVGVFIAVSNRLSLREVIGAGIAIFAGAVAALWLRRESRQHGGRGEQ